LFSSSAGYQTFEAPNVDPGIGTFAVDTDDLGRVSGWFGGTDLHTHGFVRSANGAIAVFDGSKKGSSSTNPLDMNGPGFVVGQYFLMEDPITSRGFVRAPNGVIQAIKIPGNEMVIPWAINDAGMIAGFYAKAFDNERKGFIRFPKGIYTTFAGGPECSFFDNTLFMNSNGDVAGTCGTDGSRSFLRNHHGEFVIIVYPGALETDASGVAANGDVAGSYVDADFGTHGFIRRADGTFQSFDFPDAAPGSTQVSGMDDNGDIVGTYDDAEQRLHGFIRYTD